MSNTENDLLRQPSAAPQPVKIAFPLNVHQQQVYEALFKKTPVCAGMYFGAIKVLSDSDNPESLPQAAHSLRELMEKIGPFLGVAIQDQQLKKGEGNLKDKFSRIEKLLSNAEDCSKNHKDGKWTGEIHLTTAALLVEIQTVRAWRLTNQKLRKTESEALMNTFDPLLTILPKEIQESRIGEWDKAQRFFVGVCHHKGCNHTEFQSWLFLLEMLLLRGLSTQTEENLSAIDAIIKAGECK